VRSLALFADGFSLQDAESLLFVNDGQAQVVKFDVFLDQGMCADNDLGRAVFDVFLEAFFLFGVGGAGDQFECHAEG
jgi:hypothetical protein